MKVTVCFGNVKVVVPCGDGSMTVLDLADKSLARFRKAAKKPVTENITIRHLHSLADDGILDNDDVLNDVVDDKDVLIAVFEEETPSKPPSVCIPESMKDSLNYSDKGSVNSIHTLQNKGASDGSKESVGGAEHVSIHSDHSSNTSEVQHKANNDSDYCSGSNQSREYDQPVTDPRVTKWVESVTKSSLSSIKEPPPQVRNIDEELTRNLSISSVSSRVHNNWSCQDEILTIQIEKGNSPLGLKLQPRTRPSDSRDTGVYVIGIEPDSPAERDGRLKINDRIDSINGVNLIDIPNNKALEIYEGIAITASVRLNVTRIRQPEESMIDTSQNDLSLDSPRVEIFQIVLNKGERKLGFTVATREFTTSGDKPCFVKTVHRDGAAAQDGRMKPNDVLLEVNGRSLKGMSQQEVVNIMRGLTGQVMLTLKRSKSVRTGIEVQADEPKPPQPPVPQQTRTMLTLEIPLVTAQGKSIGLGISVKGKSLEGTHDAKQDFGIFVKKILDGGAAQMDGRLQPNDQLISTDGESLCGRTNKEAMQILKRSLQLSSHTSSIILVIARKGVISHALLESDQRYNKQYSSFKDPRGDPRLMPYSGLAGDPDRFRAMSLSSPTLGKKSKSHTESDSAAPRGVAFNQVVLAIPNNTRDDGEDDVVFVSELPVQLDPFNRDNIFRKSMKKIDHEPVNENKRKMHRAASHESLHHSDKVAQIKRGLSTESIFSGPKDNGPKEGDPIYATVEPRDRSTIHNTSFQDAIQSGQSPTAPALPPPLPDDETENSESKSKSKNYFFGIFKKHPKKREDSISSQQSETPITPQGSKRDDAHIVPQHTSSPKLLFDNRGPDPYYNERHREPSNNSRDSREQYHAQRATPPRDQYNIRDHPWAPQDIPVDKIGINHRRSRSSDYQRDAEIAEKSGLGYIEHPRRQHPASRDHSYDRNSNHSNRSRESGERWDMRYRDEPRHPSARPEQPRRSSRDDRQISQSRDDRYMDVMTSKSKGFQYSNSLPPRHHYNDQSNGSRNYEQDKSRQERFPRPSYQPMISAPVSQPYQQSHEAYRHTNGRNTPEQLSDV